MLSLPLRGPIVRFVAIGVASTLAYALLYLLLRTALSAAAANVVALANTAVANTAANRRLTFGVRGRRHLVRQHALGLAVFALTVGLTEGALGALHAVSARPARAVELFVLLSAQAAGTVIRFVALRAVMAGRPQEVSCLVHA